MELGARRRKGGGRGQNRHASGNRWQLMMRLMRLRFSGRARAVIRRHPFDDVMTTRFYGKVNTLMRVKKKKKKKKKKTLVRSLKKKKKKKKKKT
eukprot:NODE_4447_length_673_cov_306.417476.p1 GENE.NODE_4447_length_673_cov_306.417476~~NODE_4447_length_673_cov_306.417476.p1  ORF type:complete len:94 (+),score=65.02 NODE_4447_length_673_cov_306.417476:376-657(+)